MLKQLVITNFALIEHVVIDPEEGLNLLTGETGAGKTILIGALGILKGNRAQTEFIRKGTDTATVEGFFDNRQAIIQAQEVGINVDDDDGILLKREISFNGKNPCYVNGQRVPLSVYNQVAHNLLDIHGQNQEQSLLETDRQRQLLDRFGKKELTEYLPEIASIFVGKNTLMKRLDKLRSEAGTAEREMDFLRFQIAEIEEKDLSPDEEVQLNQESKQLNHAEEIIAGCEKIHQLLQDPGGALEKIYAANQQIQKMLPFNDDFELHYKLVEEMYFNLEDIAHQISHYVHDVEYDGPRLNQVEQRLQDIFHLKKKYGPSIEDVLNFQASAKRKLEGFENLDEDLQDLQVTLEKKQERYQVLSKILHQQRLAIAVVLADAITEQLKALHLNRASLRIGVENSRETKYGSDEVIFYFSPNPGEGEMPLAKVASGGEIARIMLAVKTILADVDDIDVMVFDEIDTGVGGEALISVAKNLSGLASGKQVFCVTHSPQLAAFADCHFRIEKATDKDRTKTNIKKLATEEKISELYRMLGGKEIEGAYQQAIMLIESAKKMKSH